MYADRYRTHRLNPGSLTLSLTIVGGLVTAAMLSKTVVEAIERDKPLITYTVDPPPPPPPPTTPPKPRVETRAQRVDQPDVIVPTPPMPIPFDPPLPGPPPLLPGTGEGTASGPVTVDPPKPPAPVLTRADIDPRYLRDFQPVYPAEERRAGNEGVVTLKVLIGVDGRVREAQLVSSPSDAFWRVTEQRALAKWRFKPATRDGIPYETWRTMTVRFRLEAWARGWSPCAAGPILPP